MNAFHRIACRRIASRLIALGIGVVVATAAPAAPVDAQTPFELLQRARQGGGWLSIPISEGAAELATDTLPTFGLMLEGCVTVWPGHSGTWTLEAVDPLNGQRLDARVRPGEGVPFSYQTGPRSTLDVRVEWSQPRDTVLQLWVGVAVPTSGRDPCMPRYGGDSGSPTAPTGPGVADDGRSYRTGTLAVASVTAEPADISSYHVTNRRVSAASYASRFLAHRYPIG